MLRITDLTVRLGRTTAVNGASATASDGEIVAIVGPNGAGKTTLLRALAGIVDGAAVSGKITGAERSVYCPDSGLSFVDLSVAENIELLMLSLECDRRERAERGRELLSLLSPDRPIGDDPVHSLSFGLRRRLDIILTICKPADVYLFDEPYNGLDAEWAQRFSALIRALSASRRTVLVASHAVDLILPTAHAVWEFATGMLVQDLHDTPGSLNRARLMSSSSDRASDPVLAWL